MARCSIIARGIEIDESFSLDECSDVCPTGAIVVDADGVHTDPSKCLVCLACMAICGPERVRVISDWVCEETQQ